MSSCGCARLLYHAALTLGFLLQDDVLDLAGVPGGHGGALQLHGSGARRLGGAAAVGGARSCGGGRDGGGGLCRAHGH